MPRRRPDFRSGEAGDASGPKSSDCPTPAEPIFESRAVYMQRWLKVIVLSGQLFFRARCDLRVFALTYYTALSAVPLFALLYGLSRMLGLETFIQETLLIRFSQQREALLEVFSLSKNLLEGFHGGVIAMIGSIVVFGSIWFLLDHLERVVNQLWEVTGRISIRKVLSDYLVMLCAVPLLFFLLSSIRIHVFFFPYLLFWVLFSFIYWALPNCKVSISSVLVGGAISAALYLIVQWGYIYFQTQAAHYGTVYGSLSVLPLFFAWVQCCWYIFLFGAGISHAHQTMKGE